MNKKTGKFTVETFAKENNISKQSAINKLSKLKKQGFVKVSGGGKQKRIYTVSNKKIREPNGLFSVINKYSPEKINHYFKHYVFGKYNTEKAIIDGLLLNPDIRLKKSMFYLFNHITNWKRLFDLAKKHNLRKKVIELYEEARDNVKVRKLPLRYKND